MIPYSDADKDRVQQINLATFIQDHLDVVPRSTAGGRVTFCSPFREEKEPSFTVGYYRGKWRWRDWGGGPDAHGDIIELVQRLWRVDFKEAMHRLLSHEYPRVYFEREKIREELTREQRIAYASKTYLTTLKVNVLDTVIAYFEGKGVHYHLQMGSTIYTSFRDKKVFVATPIPSPRKIRGLECREVKGTARKTLGVKTLWVLKRDTKKVLVTESILDCLAGEIVLKDPTMSLCALDTTANVGKLDAFFAQYTPDECLLALDHDKAGHEATDSALAVLKKHRIRPVLVKEHIHAGVKDLHKLLITESGQEHEEVGHENNG